VRYHAWCIYTSAFGIGLGSHLELATFYACNFRQVVSLSKPSGEFPEITGVPELGMQQACMGLNHHCNYYFAIINV
jgi:hypothetical protein